MRGQTYEERAEMVATHAWETWTGNGRNLDEDMTQETMQSVNDAVANSYTEDLDDVAWLKATLARLGHVEPD